MVDAVEKILLVRAEFQDKISKPIEKLAQKTNKLTSAQKRQRSETRRLNKSFSGAGFIKTMAMTRQEFSGLDDGMGRLNKKYLKKMSLLGRLGARVRKATAGFRGFRMEMLGVMFFGMMIQRTFLGLLKPALQMSGAMELLSTVLGLMFLPVGLALIDWIMKLWDWWENASEATKGFWRSVVVAGVAIGTFLMVIGQLALGLGSIIQAFGWIVGPIFKVIGFIGSLAITILGLIGPWGILIAILFGLAIPFASAGKATDEFGKKTKSVWSSVKDFVVEKIKGIVEWMDAMWEKFLDWEPVNNFLISMGLTQEAIERLKNPLAETRNFIDTMWDKWIKNNPKVIELASKLGLEVKDLEGPFALIKGIAREIWEQFKEYWAKLIDLIKNDEFIQNLIDKFDELLTTLGEIVKIGADLASSALFKLMETLAGWALGGTKTVTKVHDVATGGTIRDYLDIPKRGEVETPEGGVSTAFPDRYINIYLKMPDGTTQQADLMESYDYSSGTPYG